MFLVVFLILESLSGVRSFAQTFIDPLLGPSAGEKDFVVVYRSKNTEYRFNFLDHQDIQSLFESILKSQKRWESMDLEDLERHAKNPKTHLPSHLRNRINECYAEWVVRRHQFSAPPAIPFLEDNSASLHPELRRFILALSLGVTPTFDLVTDVPCSVWLSGANSPSKK